PRQRRERAETSYANATGLMAGGNPRAAIPLLVKLRSFKDATKQLASARASLKADLANKLNAAAAKVDAEPAATKQAVATAMVGVDQSILGDDYGDVRNRADDLVGRADAKLKLQHATPPVAVATVATPPRMPPEKASRPTAIPTGAPPDSGVTRED